MDLACQPNRPGALSGYIDYRSVMTRNAHYLSTPAFRATFVNARTATSRSSCECAALI